MRKIITSVLSAALFLATVPAVAQAPSPARKPVRKNTQAQRYVRILEKNRGFATASWGVLALDAKGDTLAEYRSRAKLVPASNMKLITAGTALHSLGADFKYQTTIACSGSVTEGVLDGDVYIIGGGDPTTASKDSIAIPSDGLFWKWKTFLRSSEIATVKGRVIGDGRYFDGARENSTWTYDDIGTAYGTGGSGLSFYGNAQDFAVSAGASAGAPVNISVVYPSTPWMKYSHHAVTGPAGTGNSLYLFTTDLAPTGGIRGTFALDRKPKTEEFSNKFPEMTCASYFVRNLEGSGIKVEGGYADIDPDGDVRGGDFLKKGRALPPDSLRVLGRSQSPELWKIALETLHRSDNFYAETLFRTMGLKASGTAVYDSCKVAVADVLDALGKFPADGIRIEDGSGLSRRNYLSPEYMTAFLGAMKRSPAYAAFLKTLPSPGSNGTLKRVLPSEQPALKSRIKMKSGSMDGILCYSGYILPSDGKPEDAIVFSIMTNNCTLPVPQVRAAITRIIALLAAGN